MKNEIAISDEMRRPTRHGEAGFGLLKALLFVIFVGLIVAVVMKLIGVWAAIGWFVLTVVVLGVLANVSDIRRYMRISSM